MAPVVLELLEHKADFDVRVVVTGQHREQLDQVLRVFRISPDNDLAIMQHGQTLTQITTRALTGLGIVAALGIGREAFFETLKADAAPLGARAKGPVTAFDASASEDPASA